MIHNSKGDQKSLFKIVNNLLGKNNAQRLPARRLPARRLPARRLPAHSDKIQLANDFNNFYINKINTIRQNIPYDNGVGRETDFFNGDSLSVFVPVDCQELKNIIAEYGIKTSYEDILPASLMKSTIDVILLVFATLVNKSFSEGCIDGVKQSTVDPLYNQHGLDYELSKSYRPINNLEFFSSIKANKCAYDKTQLTSLQPVWVQETPQYGNNAVEFD